MIPFIDYNNGAHRCPLCRQCSHSAIYSSNMGRLQSIPKENLLMERLKCYQNEQYLKEMLEMLNPIWRDFVELLLSSKIDCNYPFYLKKRPMREVILNILFTDSVEKVRAVRAITYHTIDRANIQVIFSTGRYFKTILWAMNTPTMLLNG